MKNAHHKNDDRLKGLPERTQGKSFFLLLHIIVRAPLFSINFLMYSTASLKRFSIVSEISRCYELTHIPDLNSSFMSTTFHRL